VHYFAEQNDHRFDNWVIIGALPITTDW